MYMHLAFVAVDARTF